MKCAIFYITQPLIILIFCSFTFVPSLIAQSSKKVPHRDYWLELGLGLHNVKVDEGFLGQLNVRYRLDKETFIGGQLTGYVESRCIFCSKDRPVEHASSFAVHYGVIYESRYAVLNIALGPSFVWGTHRGQLLFTEKDPGCTFLCDRDRIHESISFKKPGIEAMLDLHLMPGKHFGLGVFLFYNANTAFPFGGLGVSILGSDSR